MERSRSSNSSSQCLSGAVSASALLRALSSAVLSPRIFFSAAVKGLFACLIFSRLSATSAETKRPSETTSLRSLRASRRSSGETRASARVSLSAAPKERSPASIEAFSARAASALWARPRVVCVLRVARRDAVRERSPLTVLRIFGDTRSATVEPRRFPSSSVATRIALLVCILAMYSEVSWM